jgi:SulP family sulfate permease
MAVTIAFVGGRPAMISAATGAVALVIAPVSREYGLDYFIATVMLAGVLQVVLALLGVAKLMRFIPRSVMVGFVNSLAILVFLSQLPHLIDVPWLVYPLVVLGVLIIVLMPKITKVVPAPLVSIVIVTAAVLVFAINVPTVGDQGELPRSLPELFIPQVPFTLETLGIIAPFAFAMALVGLMESLMTAKLVDEITDTHSNKTRESWGQGIANMLSGLFGGMGGCAVIGQTMMNVKVSGARTRISTFLAGSFLLILVVALGDIVAIIPMAALVAVMIMVSVAAFDWHSIKPSTLRRMPKSETFVMVSTVVVVVVTNNLAIGVIAGVMVASVLFVRRVAHFVEVKREVVGAGSGEISGGASGGITGFTSDGASGGTTGSTSEGASGGTTGSTSDGASAEDHPATAHYTVTGELFFASSNDLTTLFEYADDPDQVVIDMTGSHVWDASTVAALDAIVTKYERYGKTVELRGMNKYTSAFHDRLSGEFGL